jgi:hypothetical protein
VLFFFFIFLLVAPEPIISKKPVPLFMVGGEYKDENMLRIKTRTYLSDDTHFFKIKYRSTPSSVMEHNDIKKTLSLSDLAFISVGSRQIDFGKIVFIYLNVYILKFYYFIFF